MTRAPNRFIPSEELSHVAEWSFDAVDQASLRFAAKVQAQADAEEQAKARMHREAGSAEGYAQGHKQGLLEGQQQLDDYIAEQGQLAAEQFGQLFASADAGIAAAQQVMAQGVLELACTLARQVLRRELSVNPDVLQPVVQEALAALAVDCKAAVVRMHPADFAVLGQGVAQAFPSMVLTLVPDAQITPGGCVVEAAGTVVDGTVQKRWARAVASLGLESTWESGDDTH